MSALLHALASLTVAHIQHVGDIPVPLDDGEALPITSYLCQGNEPRKRKESNMPISEAVFQKHVYGRQRKRELKPIEKDIKCCVMAVGLVLLVHSCFAKSYTLIITKFVNDHTCITLV